MLTSQVLRHMTVKIGQVSLNCVRVGDEKKKAVLLLPGIFGTAENDFPSQLKVLPELLQDHAIISWDPPGYGKSRPPVRKFHKDFYQEDAYLANAVMHDLGFPSYSVLGWSDGSITGLFMGATYPSSVSKLIACNAKAYISDQDLRAYNFMRDISNWSDRIRESIIETYGREEFQRLLNEYVDVLQTIKDDREGDICKHHLKKIVCPTLIIQGAKDPLIAPEHGPFLKQHIRNSKLHIIPEGKHNIHLRYADVMNELFVKFLK